MKKVLTVLYQSDDNYAPQTGVSMISLMENNKHLDGISIYVLNDNISPENIERLQKACDSYDRELILVDTSEILKKLLDLKVFPFRGGYTTYFKLFAIGRIEAPSGRLLQIDGDTIINKPLDELLEMDLEGYVCAATPDCTLNDYKEFIGIPTEAKYYNCGVLMVNQEYWRSYECEEKIVEHLQGGRHGYFTVDQDIINVLFGDKVTYMHIKYNLNSGFYIYGVDESYEIYDLDDKWFSTREQLDEAMADPFINHCMGAMTGRPWENNSIHPQNELYDSYLRISPWADFPKIDVKRSLLFRLQRRAYLLLPRKMYGRIHRAVLKRYLKEMDKKAREQA